MDERITLNDINVEIESKERMPSTITCLERFRSIFGKVALIALTGFLFERTYGTLCHYFENPTYFETRYVRQFHAQMPALTMCPLKGYKPLVLKVKFCEQRK